MDKGVELVEQSHEAQMSIQKEALEIHLGDRKENLRHSVMFQIQYRDSMRLCQLGNLVIGIPVVQCSSNLLRQSISQKVQRPVEHLDQEGEALEDSRWEIHIRVGLRDEWAID